MFSTATVHELQQRITEMQPLRLDDRALPTASALRPLLPGGAVRKGSSYAVHGSSQLGFALLAEASASGAWCGVVGCPDFGAEAASSAGIALERCVVVPNPGAAALGITGSLSEILTIIVVRTAPATRSGETERISARLREHGAVVIALGDWPRAESTLRVTRSRWAGLDEGHGTLTHRELTVSSIDRRGELVHTVRFDRAGVPLQVPSVTQGRRLVAL